METRPFRSHWSIGSFTTRVCADWYCSRGASPLLGKRVQLRQARLSTWRKDHRRGRPVSHGTHAVGRLFAGLWCWRSALILTRPRSPPAAPSCPSRGESSLRIAAGAASAVVTTLGVVSQVYCWVMLLNEEAIGVDKRFTSHSSACLPRTSPLLVTVLDPRGAAHLTKDSLTQGARQRDQGRRAASSLSRVEK